MSKLKNVLFLCLFCFIGFVYADYSYATYPTPPALGLIKWLGEWSSKYQYPWKLYVPLQKDEVTYKNKVYINISPATPGVAPDIDPDEWQVIGLISTESNIAQSNGVASVSINTIAHQTIYPYKSGVSYPTYSLTYAEFSNDTNTNKYISKAGNNYFAWNISTPSCVNVKVNGEVRISSQANLVGGANGASGVYNYSFASAILINGKSLLDPRMFNTVSSSASTNNIATDSGSGSPAFLITAVKKNDIICPAYGMVVTSRFTNGLYADFAMNIDFIEEN